MSVGSVLCYKGEEGILLRDGWIEWGQQKHPDLLVWAIDVRQLSVLWLATLLILTMIRFAKHLA